MLATSKRKVAVLGTATTSLDQAPVNDPSWEIWGCSPWMQGRLNPRSDDAGGFDRFFEIHAPAQFYPDEKANFIPWLAGCGKPVYVMHDLGLPNQVFYPRAEILAQHGSAFLTSSIAWMLALAIDERPAEIGIWGVDMANDTEYAEQKAGCLHFIALARLLGINIRIPANSELNRVPLPYPERQGTEAALVLRRKLDEAEANLKAVEQNAAIFRDARVKLTAEIELLKTLQRTLL